MKMKIPFCLIAVAFFFEVAFATVDVPGDLARPLDLSFVANQWRFTDSDNPDYKSINWDDSSWGTVPTLPHNWKKTGADPGSSSNIAWYRISLKFPGGTYPGALAFKLGTITAADEVYFNGRLIGKTGIIDDELKSHGNIDWEKPRLYSITSDMILPGQANVLAVRVYSPFSHEAGFISPAGNIVLGFQEGLLKGSSSNDMLVLAIVVVIMTFSAYFLLLFIRRPRSFENLFYSMASILIGTFFFLESPLKYNTGLGFDLMYRIKFIAWFSMVSLFCDFIYFYYPTENIKFRKINRFLLVLANIPALSVLVPVISGDVVAIKMYNLTYFQFMVILPVLVSIWLILYNIIRKNRDAMYMLAGGLITIAGLLSEILVNRGVVSMVPFAHISFLFFILTFAGILANRFVRLHNEVEDLNVNLEKKVTERTEELRRAMDELEAMNQNLIETRNQLWGEMELAKKIQTVLLPDAPKIEGYEITAFMAPADEVGGDYYDIISMGGYNWLIIGDVSGHGVPAGLVMMMVQTSMQVILTENPGLGPSDLLSIINRAIARNIKKLGEEKYMTITAMACMEEGKFHFSGLHQDILVYRSGTGTVDVIETEGMWIGLLDEISHMIKDNNLSLNHGDTMLLFTDGITEAWSQGGIASELSMENNMFGESRLHSLLEKHGGRPTEEIKKIILEQLTDYTKDDDITMVIVKRL